MQFNNHYNLQGKHAIFSASQSAWLRYDDDKALEVYNNKKATELGTRLHAFAAEAISLGIKQAKSKKTLPSYINDAIGFKMQPEVVLYYSDRFFGTADAISFRNGMLRIHDLKTGKNPVHIDQLLVYAALFCLEYRIKPGEIDIELRIYQNDEILYHNPEADEILPIMDKIIHLNKLLEKLEEEV
ncbi:MAG: DUF2800 domain-containing protein [Ruminococcus sp.]|nr:DUF2800 domain-containing protein [Ruminococcus sp.]MBO5319110.1 DUF2800 domain-containing protein [Ruminococcus sp.]